MATPDNPQEIALITRLVQIEQSGDYERLIIRIGPYSAFLLISALQLTWRHPGLSPQLKQVIHDIARQVQRQFRGPTYDLLEKGWHTTLDKD